MKKLSRWAKHHPWKARIIIVLSHVVLLLIAKFTGESLAEMNWQLPGFALLISLLVFLTATFSYPEAGASYWKRKTYDGLLATATFGMAFCLFNQNGFEISSFQPVSASMNVTTKPIEPSAEEILASLKYRDKSTLTRIEKRILKREFKAQLKIFIVSKITGKKEASGQAGLIILAIVAALGLLYLVAALSCSISCNGSDGGAIAVALLGTAGVIWAFIAVMRAIKRKGKKKDESG